MRVEGNRPIRPAATRRDDKSGAASVGSFAEALGAEAAAPPSATAPTGSIGALFALQEVPDATARRRKAVARAAKMLDRLDELQLGLVEGAIDRHALVDLAAAARSAREDTGDPTLQGVLDEIELRAAVELAKLSMSL
jgi:hypothetical protein